MDFLVRCRYCLFLVAGVVAAEHLNASAAFRVECPIWQRQVSEPEQLSDFSVAGYRFSEKDSNGQELVFLREEQ